jgi:hypothetical protein
MNEGVDTLFLYSSLLTIISHLGHPEYGCLISQDKTLTNFDYDAQIMNVTEPQQQRE